MLPIPPRSDTLREEVSLPADTVWIRFEWVYVLEERSTVWQYWHLVGPVRRGGPRGGLWVTRRRCTLKTDFYLSCSGMMSIVVWISVSYDLNTNCSHKWHMGHLLSAGNTGLEVSETLRGDHLGRRIVGYLPS